MNPKIRSHMKYCLSIMFFSILSFPSCFNRINCDQSDNVRLGEIDYSTTLKSWNLEKENDSLTFHADNNNFTLERHRTSQLEENRLIEKPVCESIDIKPYTAYEYYAYPNEEAIFTGDSVLVNINPQIFNNNGQRSEVLCLTLSSGISASFKGIIPINTEEFTTPLEDIELLDFKNSVTLRNVVYSNVWVMQKGAYGLYYSTTDGIIALEINGTIYTRSH